jgi:sulfide:quinone oxidoreductase
LEINRLTETLCVTGQLAPADLQAIAAAGFKSIVCNRPDAEVEGQPSFVQLATAAGHSGLRLELHFLPVVSGKVTAADGRRFAELITRLPLPVLAYCRSGTRSATLWAFSQIGKMSRLEILESAAEAGYDLGSLIPPDRGTAP